MPTVSQALRSFLVARQGHNADLVARYLQHAPHLETQVNVFAGHGQPVEGKRNTYSDGVREWFSLRIPRNANSTPEWRDYDLSYPLDDHADAIGCTGWDWYARRSRWVGFDFDSITGHAAGVGISDDELLRIKEIATALPYVEVRKSTGGNGLHLYVALDVPTENHTVHAALARAVLGMMSSETGFDFSAQIDACGGNMWIWARKMVGTEGLKLIKPAERPLAELPSNWRDHLEVVSRKRSKVRVHFIDDAHYDPFESLASGRRIIPLDNKHKALIDALGQSGYACIWVGDHHLLQTHTCALQQIIDDQRDELGIIGFFKTNSEGRDRATPNCFLFPLDAGGWKVFRFTPGIQEAETWEQDGDGWTTCFFNRIPSLRVASRVVGGLKEPDKNEYVFNTAAAAMKAAESLGQMISLPDNLHSRKTILKTGKDGRLIVQVEKDERDEGMTHRGWLGKKDYWVQEFETRVDQKVKDLESTDLDEVVRALLSPSGNRAGWMVRQNNGRWAGMPKDDAKSALLCDGFDKPEVEVLLGRATKNGWNIVNLPFQPEYPGNRQWNLGAAQYRYQPADLPDDQQPHHPHWDMVLKHCGQDLDHSLQELEWAQSANIKSGRDYLLTWVACMLREPYEKLPFLFLYGEQNSGKSILHEAFALLMTGGVAAADRALTNPNDFNGELANAVLAYIEEKNISLSPGAYNKLKDWVTSPTIWIRKMRTDAYAQANTLHFIQTSNDRDMLTIRPGDTRITVMFVPELEYEIPKPLLISKLQEEAPHFMRTIVDLALPPLIGRLRLPMVANSNKERAEDYSRNPLESFIAEVCFHVPGDMIPFPDFYRRFCEWLDVEQPPDYTLWKNKKKITQALPPSIPFGAGPKNIRHIGNLSFEEKVSEARPLILNGKQRLKTQP